MRRYSPALFFAILSLVFLWRSTIGGHALLPGAYLAQMQPWKATQVAPEVRQWDPIQWDAIAEFYPWRAFYGRSIREGALPLWNPYQFCGTPFAANGQSAVFYPPNLIFALIPPEVALGWSAALHLFLAGLFTFLLIRYLGMGLFGAYIGGISYAFSAFMITWLELPTLINVAAWLPLVLLLIFSAVKTGKPALAAGTGVALALAVLAGHLQIALYVFLMAGALWVWLIVREAILTRRVALPIILAILTFVVALLIAAPQLLPTLELVQLSHRVRQSGGDDFARFQSNAIPLHNLITALVPDFFGNPSKGNYWNGVPYAEFALYIGVLPFVLAIIGVVHGLRRVRYASFFVAAAALSLLSAFGSFVNIPLYYGIPGFSALGGPNRIIVLYTLAMAVLAGIGADWFAGICCKNDCPADDRDVKPPCRAALIAIFVVLVFYVGTFIATIAEFQKLDQSSLGDLLSQIRPQVATFAMLFLGAVLILLLRGAARISRLVFVGLIISLLIADLFSFGIHYNPTCAKSLVSQENPTATSLRKIVGDQRIMPLNAHWSLYSLPKATLPPNMSTLYGLYDVQGYDSLFTRRYKDFALTDLGRRRSADAG